ncbi:hypothetical protein NPIL_474991 [Nephila pilipes]|uniref:Uncharacterized protein n=1 Tax=Nephila pilipes TaxID=299642 RepID=A0A8X6N022_NEPPI|nr:hypothetical protein NPIL_474991 [Nephila pilipes]
MAFPPACHSCLITPCKRLPLPSKALGCIAKIPKPSLKPFYIHVAAVRPSNNSAAGPYQNPYRRRYTPAYLYHATYFR